MQPQGHEIKALLAHTDLKDARSLECYARNMVGMTFRDILNLGIAPEDANEKDYNRASYKGGMGNLIEERFFGYRSNSDERPDFPEAGVELKATCFDIRKRDKELTAGERLVLSMIPFDREIEEDLLDSHVWAKCNLILLVYYRRDKSVDKYDQRIEYVQLFTPPAEDLAIMREDYKTIAAYIKSGRAHELSEGLTTYLGAATKGASEKTMWVEQFYPLEREGLAPKRYPAKKRAFSFKRQYMDYALHHYLMNRKSDAEHIFSEDFNGDMSFEDRVSNLVSRYVNMTDREIAKAFGIPYTGNKSQWATLVYRMLGIKSNRAAEFVKAGISVRTVRIEEDGTVRENLSLNPFEFKQLVKEDWDTSPFHAYLEETKFFFVVFRNIRGVYRLAGSMFWNMPEAEIEGDAKRCWEQTRETIRQGVSIIAQPPNKSGIVKYKNNLPGNSDNRIAHVRPHASRRAYLFPDGTQIGNIKKDGSELPDGRYLTRQSFWLNNTYIRTVIANLQNTQGAENGK